MNLRLLENHSCWVLGYETGSSRSVQLVEGWTELVQDRLGDLQRATLEVKQRHGDIVHHLEPVEVLSDGSGFRLSFEIEDLLASLAESLDSTASSTLDFSLSNGSNRMRLSSPYYSEPFVIAGSFYCKPYQTVHGNHSLKLTTAARTSTKEVFSQHFEANRWGSDESRSGSGSTLQYTAGLRSALPEFVANHDIKSILDAPCGDYNWFNSVRPDLPVTYLGVDIVEPMIVAIREQYADDRTNFEVKDIVTDAVGPHDLVFCRDCLFHLPYEMIFKALYTFVESGSKYLLTTSHYDCKYNSDIPLGEYRKIDLCKAPFSFPPPLEKIDDYPEGKAPRFLGLWELKSLGEHLARNPEYVAANAGREQH